MNNPLTFDYIFSTPTDFGSYAIAYFVVCTIGTAIANFIFFSGKYRFKNNLLTYTLVNRASRNAAVAFTLGFVFFLCRIVKLQPFNARLFLDLSLILLVYFIVRGVGYMARTYPKAKAEWQTMQERNTRRGEPRGTAIRPASNPATTPVTKVATATASADGGGEESIEATSPTIQPAQPLRSPGSLSERGQKRRERKRNKR